MSTTARRGAKPPAPPQEPAVAGPEQGAPGAPASRRLRITLAPSTVVLAGVVFWGLFLVGFFFARFIDVLLTIFLAILFSTFLSPIVNALEKLHIPRAIGILLVYLAILGVMALVGFLAVPLFTQETQRLEGVLLSDFQRLASFLTRFGIHIPTNLTKAVSAKGFLSGLTGGGGQGVVGIAGQAIGVVVTIGTLVVAILAILVMTFLLTVRKTFTADVMNTLLPPKHRKRTIFVLNHMGERMGGWVIGQVIVTIYYAAAFSLGLWIVHVPDAVSIGVITGLLEIIPFVGGFIGILLAVLVAATVSPLTILWVIILYLIVTNVEAHVLVPIIYAHSVHIHPFLVVVALLFGGVSFGILGALIAVPVAAALQVAVEHLYIEDVVEADHPAPGPILKRPLLDRARVPHAGQRRRPPPT
jgi:predicted PurR-regulated permease PerM